MSFSRIGLARTATLLCAAAAGVGASTALARHGSTQSSAPTQITLTDTVTAQPSSGALGTFLASALVCSSGAFTDQDVVGISITTKHTCDDGSGEFDSVGRDATNRWSFTGGTGPYATLRGGGACQVTTTSDGKTIRTCQLLAAFDDVAPSGAIDRFSASAGRRARTAKIKASFEGADDVAGNAVRFQLGVRAGAHVLATRKGTTTGKPISFSLAVRLPKAARKLTLRVVLTDPVGNTRTLVRAAFIRRSRR
jgi:hypothetical protein